MNPDQNRSKPSSAAPQIGYACAYTPLALIEAAGFSPYRLLPLTTAPDQAGSVLHDNVCPFVKRLIDRALAQDLPDLAGMVFMNSCDTMRRLADAWPLLQPDAPMLLLDLPLNNTPRSRAFFAQELARLRAWLWQLNGSTINDEHIGQGIDRLHELALMLGELGQALIQRTGGRSLFQRILNYAMTSPLDEALSEIKSARQQVEQLPRAAGIKAYLFGNIMPDPEAFTMLAESGFQVVGDELCTGSKLFLPLRRSDHEPTLDALARLTLSRPACARMITTGDPGSFARQVLEGARASGARCVIAQVMKFCDPYLGRIPAVRAVLQEARLPFLFIEGDCSLRALGQQQTRLEALAEMVTE